MDFRQVAVECKIKEKYGKVSCIFQQEQQVGVGAHLISGLQIGQSEKRKKRRLDKMYLKDQPKLILNKEVDRGW